jgi:sugar (pentulose or hexulose) kinase
LCKDNFLISIYQYLSPHNKDVQIKHYQNIYFYPQIEHLYPESGWDEIEPDELWKNVVSVIRDAVKGEHCSTSLTTSFMGDWGFYHADDKVLGMSGCYS